MATLAPPSDLISLLRQSLPQEVADESSNELSGNEEILGYVACLAAGLADSHQFDASVWEEALSPYLSSIILEDNAAVVEKFRAATEEARVGVDAEEEYGDEDDDGAEELCDLRFK